MSTFTPASTFSICRNSQLWGVACVASCPAPGKARVTWAQFTSALALRSVLCDAEYDVRYVLSCVGRLLHLSAGGQGWVEMKRRGNAPPAFTLGMICVLSWALPGQGREISASFRKLET